MSVRDWLDENVPRLHALDRDGATGITGIAEGFNGRAWVDRWAADPWVQGSYAAYLPGQYTKYYGFVGKPEGNIHFAGEHTATANQGYLEGAVESGERSAREVLHDASTYDEHREVWNGSIGRRLTA